MAQIGIPVPILAEQGQDFSLAQCQAERLAAALSEGSLIHCECDSLTAYDRRENNVDGMSFDAIVLDIMMPGEDGLTFTKRLKEQPHPLPVLLLTAMGETDDRITGL